MFVPTPAGHWQNAMGRVASLGGTENGHLTGNQAVKRLLIINPNTTAMVTDRVTAAARASLPGVDLISATGRFGAAYISSRASFTVAGHAALDALAEWGTGVDAVLLACFGDPGLDALREVSQVPVIGLVEAACAEAGEGGRPFSIVTGGERWGPMLREMIMLAASTRRWPHHHGRADGGADRGGSGRRYRPSRRYLPGLRRTRWGWGRYPWRRRAHRAGSQGRAAARRASDLLGRSGLPRGGARH